MFCRCLRRTSSPGLSRGSRRRDVSLSLCSGWRRGRHSGFRLKRSFFFLQVKSRRGGCCCGRGCLGCGDRVFRRAGGGSCDFCGFFRIICQIRILCCLNDRGCHGSGRRGGGRACGGALTGRQGNLRSGRRWLFLRVFRYSGHSGDYSGNPKCGAAPDTVDQPGACMIFIGTAAGGTCISHENSFSFFHSMPEHVSAQALSTSNSHFKVFRIWTLKLTISR